METIVPLAVLVGGLLLLLAMGLEVAWSIGLMAVVGMVFFSHQPVERLVFSAWGSLNTFTLTALPLFIMMGSILARSGVTEYLISALDKWMGRFPGGILTAVIAGNAIFGAMSGSSVAACATFGKIVFPSAESRGYQPSLALGAIAVGGMLAPLIPPSLILIIYGAWAGVPVVKLFAAGVVPGLILGLLFIILIAIRVKLSPTLTPPPPAVRWRERLVALGGIFPFLLIVAGVLGVIFGGVMTPTEAAAMGAALSLIVSLAYRRMTAVILKDSLLETVSVTAMALFILTMATALSYVLNIVGITPQLTEFFLGLTIGKYGVLVLFYLMYLIMGCFFDTWSMLFLTFPFVMPVIVSLGINPIWWGVVYVIAAEQCVVTPPFGLHLFVLKNLFPQYSIGTIVRGSLPFLICMYVEIALLTAFPQLVLWLPSLIGR